MRVTSDYLKEKSKILFMQNDHQNDWQMSH